MRVGGLLQNLLCYFLACLLVRLNLENNELGAGGAIAVAKALLSNTVLQELNLSENRITAIDKVCISRAGGQRNALYGASSEIE